MTICFPFDRRGVAARLMCMQIMHAINGDGDGDGGGDDAMMMAMIDSDDGNDGG